jgi:hypothetical protein
MECLGGGPGAMARLRCQSYQAKVDGHWPGGSSWQTGHFASAIWKFLFGFALALQLAPGHASHVERESAERTDQSLKRVVT